MLTVYAVAAALALRDAAGAADQMDVARQELGGILHGEDLAGVSRAQVAAAGRRLDGVATRLRRDQRLLGPAFVVTRHLGWVPYAGQPIADAADLLALTQEIAEGGAALAHGVDPLLAETEAGADGGAATRQDSATPSTLAGGTPVGTNATAPPASAPKGATATQSAASIDATAPPSANAAGATDDRQAPAERLVQALDAGAADLRRGDRLVNRAATRRARLQPAGYRGPFSTLRHRVEQLDADLPTLLNHAHALALLPDAARTLLGFDGPRTYVVLGQDSAEIRPTGGFIGSAGLITFDHGRLVYQEYRSSYDFDNPNVSPLLPPAALVRYLGAGAWFLRDANWAPDFPTAAKQVEAFVLRDTGVQVDGVIAFDDFAVTDLLAALGPLTFSRIGLTVTADNWLDRTTRAIFTGPDSLVAAVQDYQQAKGAGLGAVLQAVLARAQGAQGHDLFAVVDALRRAASGGHLLLGLDDPPPAEWARIAGSDGSLYPPPDGDVIGAVDANVGYAKVGRTSNAPWTMKSGSTPMAAHARRACGCAIGTPWTPRRSPTRRSGSRARSGNRPRASSCPYPASSRTICGSTSPKTRARIGSRAC